MPANNELSTQNWVLQDPRPNVPVKPGTVKIGSINYLGYAHQDHHVMLKDSKGNVIFESYGNPDLSPISTHFDPIWVDGVILEALDSGKVIVTVL